MGFTSVFIWIYTLTLPLERSASSIWVRMFSGEEVHVTGLSEGCLVSAPLETIICIGNHYPTDLPSNVTLPLATGLCSVS